MPAPDHLNRTLISGLLLSILVACGGGGGGSDAGTGSASSSSSSGSSSSSSGGMVVSTPIISQQPQAFTTEAGTIAVFSVKADSASPLTYQWRRQGVDIPGATRSSYSFQTKAGDNGSELSVLVSNSQGSVLSAGARLQVSPQPGIMLLAGQPGQSGMADGNAATALFSEPAGLARDAMGNLFVSDSGNKVIRKISVDGTVSTFAGKAGESGFIDGASAEARFAKPEGLAFDGTGNLYVADTGNNSIRKIAANGQVSTLYNETQTIFPYLAVNASGTAYYGVHDWAVSECTAIKSFAAGAGSASALAGTITFQTRCTEYNPADGTGNQAGIHPLKGLNIDSAGELYATTSGTLASSPAAIAIWNSLVKISASGQKTTLMQRYFMAGTAPSAVDYALGDLVVSPSSEIFMLANGANCARMFKYGTTGSLDAVAGQCGTPALSLGPLPGSLQRDMRGLVMDNEGSLYTTTQNAVIKVRLK